MKKFVVFLLAFYMISTVLKGQEKDHPSIHIEQNKYYKSLYQKGISNWDSVMGIDPGYEVEEDTSIRLNKRIFGWHPYWSGNAHLNYRWNLLSDLCYFSYEVDPNTGDAVTIHDWHDAPAIDSALANDTRVHLCVTLFDNHKSFLENTQARQNLIDNLIVLIQERNAHGINIDFEAIPTAQAENFNDFLVDLSIQFHQSMPEGILSIAAPAVNWNNKFNLPLLHDFIDWFVIMGYDYYWNGSSQAGPVDPLHTLSNYFDYNLSRTASYYQQYIPNDRILLGLPYYARQWPTDQKLAPSKVRGYGTAFTYNYIRDHSDETYSSENQYFENNSQSNYYAFNNEGWFQCFVESGFSMGKRFEMVNRRKLGGIGIWALGYDDGHDTYWNRIRDKFSNKRVFPETDTIYDSGGPAFNYYDHEDYTYTLHSDEASGIDLYFTEFELEEGYDSLWIYEGPNTNYPLMGVYTGADNPGHIHSDQPWLTLRFKSDGAATASGWRATLNTKPDAIGENPVAGSFKIYPNPFHEKLTVQFKSQHNGNVVLQLIDLTGHVLQQQEQSINPNQQNQFNLNTHNLSPGVYFIQLFLNEGEIRTQKIFKY
ncbi:MAG: T9SS type A sorting domain-containing protein [Bacteroidales bacterium]|nr:T9SS type A sorting domain-containing protein [Bacteroidales bacterium]